MGKIYLSAKTWENAFERKERNRRLLLHEQFCEEALVSHTKTDKRLLSESGEMLPSSGHYSVVRQRSLEQKKKKKDERFQMSR